MNKQKINAYLSLLYKIKNTQKITIISHKNPDIDTVSSALAFYKLIQIIDKILNIELVCIDKIPEKFWFLWDISIFKNDFTPNKKDLIIFMDSSSPDISGFENIYPEIYHKNSYNTINIDHHFTNKLFWKQNIVNAYFASNTMIIYDFCESLWIIIPKEIANLLLAWIMSDTWSLKHANTDNKVLEVVWKLVSYCANINFIVDNFFHKNNINTLKMWWKIIWNSFIENDILHAYVNKTDLESYDCNYDDISWVVDYLNMVWEAQYTTLLTQKWDFVRGSLRTLRNDVDLSKIAKKLNGWWHKKASGFTLEWKLEIHKEVSLYK